MQQSHYLRALTAAWTPASNSCAATPTSTTLGGPAKYWTTYAVNPANGNRTQVVNKPTASGGATTTSNYTYAGTQPHAVSSISTVTGASTTVSSYGYDASGSTTTRPGQTLSYGPTNKVQNITKTAGSAEQSNVYDADGNLLLQTDPTAGTTLFAGDTEYIRAPGATAASAVRTYSHNGIPIAERTTTVGVTSSKVRWLATDINKTVDIQVVSADGTINRRYTDPYGNTRGTVPPWGSNHTYLNAPKSTFSGLVQLGARAYDSTIGKFLSVDPVLAPANPQQNNGYAYASNTPITLSDPSGLCASARVDSCDPGGPKKTTTTNTDNGQPPAAAGGGGDDDAGDSEWWNPTTWSSDTWQTIGAIGAGVVAGIIVTAAIVGATACTAVTFGVCGVVILGAAVAGGAAAGALTYNLSPGEKTAQGYGQAVGWGAAGGLAGGALGAGVGALAGRAGSSASSAIIESARLSARVDEVVAPLDKMAETYRTVAVLSTREGPDVLASGGRDLDPAQRVLAGPTDILGHMPKAHAEVTALSEAASKGLSPAQIATSKTICPSCQQTILDSGGQILPGGFGAVWPK